MFLGVDTGGTFTDFVLLRDGQITIHKVLSTPSAPEQAILQGIAELNLSEAMARGRLAIVHGSTVATNAALEGKGVLTVFITNRGFKDMLSIGRQARRELYNLQPAVVEPPVPANLCLEVDCRVDAHGNVIKELTDTQIETLVQQIITLQPRAAAINLLFSYLNSEHEERLQSAIAPHCFVSRSSFVLPEYKEYERGIATWLNAYLGPLVANYLQNLREAVSPSPLTIMQSSGGTIDATQAGRRAVNLLLSGPAGGLAAAKFISSLCHTKGLMTFDMGGTSTDVALIEDELRITNEGRLGPYPVAVPMVDMHTIGAGGGSIATIDDGGLLHVGPQSAGADPGPACYGRGGPHPTVTDANVVLGRIRPDARLAGNMALDVEAARQAVATIAEKLKLPPAEAALGIVQVANEHMARALRVISVQRGYDPKQFHLCSFGGAGALHVCDLAESLTMTEAIVPRYSGVLSALGMLVAPRERQLSHSMPQLLDQLSEAEVMNALRQLEQQGRSELIAEGVSEAEIQHQAGLDLRYRGQSYAINIDYSNLKNCAGQFHQRHQQLYGHSLDRPIELVTVRQRVFSPALPLVLPTIQKTLEQDDSDLADLYGIGPTKILQREQLGAGDELPGPLLIIEAVATTLVKPGWRMRVDEYGNLLLRR